MQKWTMLVVMMVLLACSGFAGTDPSSTTLAPQPITPEAILGFETLSGWQATVGVPTAQLKLTPVRTQGSLAYSVTNPGNSLKLTSVSIPSTASSLAGLGAAGASIAVDIRFPVGRNSSNTGSLRLSLTSPSRGLNKAPLGKVDFLTVRPGTFQTIVFPLTDQARGALVGANFNDLSFELSFTQLEPGEYLVDNLRVRSRQTGPADATTKPPLGYGGSVDFDLNLPDPGLGSTSTLVGDVPVSSSVVVPAAAVEQSFDVGAIQIPAQFHVKTGTAVLGSTVGLDLGYSPDSIITTCLYKPDATDKKLKTYVFSSCSGGSQPGDITSATWARLGIINGVTPLRIRAQIARRPLGDLMGSRIIPPMPTFWGDEDACIPTQVSAHEISASQSCTDNLAQTSKIVTDYMKAATSANPGIGWIVTPIPEWAKQHGNPDAATSSASLSGASSSSLSLAPVRTLSGLNSFAGTASIPIPPGTERHIDKGGLFDAYWVLTGGLDFSSFPDSDRATTHFDADFSTHVVLLGIPANVMNVSVESDTDTGQTTPSPLPSTASASAQLHILGFKYPDFNQSVSGEISKEFPLYAPPTLDLLPIRFWIFKVALGVRAQAGLTLSGGISGRGLELGLTPEGSVQGTLFGGVDIIVASGGVQADIDMIRITDPIIASLTWDIDAAPTVCQGSIIASIDNDMTFSSGGGEVDLVATFGVWPFEDEESYRILHWKPIASHTISVFHEATPLAKFPLPISLCGAAPLAVAIDSPSGTVVPGYLYTLSGTAFSTLSVGTKIDCSKFVWTNDNAADTIHGQGCAAKIEFGNTPHQSTITLSVSDQVFDASGRSIPESGSRTQVVTVSPLSPGVHIQAVYDVTANKEIGFRPLGVNTGPSAGGYILFGTFVDLPGVDTNDVTYQWTIRHNGITTDNTCNFSTNPDACVFGKNLVYTLLDDYWAPTPDPEGDGYTVTVKAVSKTTGAVYSTDSFDAQFYNVVR